MWYTVQSGDSLYSISQKFGVSAAVIREANKLAGNALNVGQRLYIPVPAGQQVSYTVRRGDTLSSIARNFSTTVESIVSLNNLTGTGLNVGQRLVIPVYSQAIVNVDVANIRSAPGLNSNVVARMVRTARLPVTASSQGWYRVRIYDGRYGWISNSVSQLRAYGNDKPVTDIVGFYSLEEGPALPSSFTSFTNNTEYLFSAPLFMWRFNRNNPTQVEKFGQFSDRDVENLVAIGHRNNVMMMPVVHNLLYGSGGQTASKDVVKQVFATRQSRAAAIQSIINLVQRYNFDGANIDIEDVYKEDSERLSAFYTELGAAMRQRGYYLSASVPARISDQPFNPFSDPFNYSVIGRAVDQFIVMLYNEHGWPGSGPGPVVSIGWMERVVRYTMTKMPWYKIVGAVSVFGFDFNLTTNRNTYVTYQAAIDLARRYNQQVIWDTPTQTPMFRYQDAQGNRHEVWFENSFSAEAKARLAWSLGIAGIALWRLGMEDPAVWTMAERNIVTRKYY